MKILSILCVCLSFLGASYANSKVCNPFKCFSLISSFFQISGSSDEDACLKINKIQKCVLDCSFEVSENNHLTRGFATVEHEICKDVDFSINLYKKANKYQCYVDANKFSLLMCFYEKFNQIEVDPKFDHKLFTCSLLDSAQHCPSSSTSKQCADSNVVETLTTLFLKPWRDEYCESFSVEDIKEFKMTSVPDSEDYYKLGKCLDENSNRTMSCIPEKWTSTNFVINPHFNRKLCDAVDMFMGCVANMIQQHCSGISEMFSHLQRLLSRHFFPQCSAEDSSTGAASPLAGTVDASAENTSEVETVHIYQQIKIVELHHHHHLLNSASGTSCCWGQLVSLLVLKIFF